MSLPSILGLFFPINLSMKRAFLTLKLFFLLCLFLGLSNLTASAQEEMEYVNPLERRLKNLYAIDEYLSAEKLTKKPSEAEAYIELGNLRRMQGEFEESERFYKMALKLEPNSLQAMQGLGMLYYVMGDFEKAKSLMNQTFPEAFVSDEEKIMAEALKEKENTSIFSGLNIYENDKNITESDGFIEVYWASDHRLSTSLALNYLTYEEYNSKEVNKKAGLTLYFKPSNSLSVSMNANTLLYSQGSSLNGYSLTAAAESGNFTATAIASKEAFRDNIFTIRNRYYKNFGKLALLGKLKGKANIIQGISASKVSDGNKFYGFDTEFVKPLFEDEKNILTASARVFYETATKQKDANGIYLNYWMPKEYQGGELRVSLERKHTKKLSLGCDLQYMQSSYRLDDSVKKVKSNGVGAGVSAKYKNKDFEAAGYFGEKLRQNYRERRLEVSGFWSFF